MQAPQRAALAIERQAALHEPGIQSAFLEFIHTKRAREKSALVLLALDINHERSFQLRFGENHCFPPFTVFVAATRRSAAIFCYRGALQSHRYKMTGSGIGTMNFPPQSRMPFICPITSSLMFQGRIKT